LTPLLSAIRNLRFMVPCLIPCKTAYTKSSKERQSMVRELIELKDEVIEDRFTLTQETKLFEGAGLVISDNDSMEESERYILVKTPHAKALSALIYRLKEIFRGEIDGFTKYAFYGRLGEAALKSQDDVRTLLLDVIDEAFRFIGSGESIEYFAYVPIWMRIK